MKKVALSSTLIGLVLLACFFSCEKTSDEPKQNPVFLKDAPNLAVQNEGFYSKVGQVELVSTKAGDQTQINIDLHDPNINPYQVKLYLDKKANFDEWKAGKYEVLFLRSALILNDPVTGKKLEFVVKNDVFDDMQAKLPTGYISANAIEAIGIAVYGNHNDKRSAADLVPTCSNSGGPGSVSCSNACCSVSCSSGYYASCQSNCTCVKS